MALKGNNIKDKIDDLHCKAVKILPTSFLGRINKSEDGSWNL